MHLWDCPALKAFKEKLDPQLAKLNSKNTPPHLLLGIPDKLLAGNTTSFLKPNPPEQIHREVDQVFSYDPDISVDDQRVMHSLCPLEEPIDVQQLSYKLLSSTGRTLLTDISIVQEKAPRRPNVSTDGSLPRPGTGPS